MSLSYIHTLQYSVTFDSERYEIALRHGECGEMAVLHFDGVRLADGRALTAAALAFKEVVYMTADRFDVRFYTEDTMVVLSLTAEQTGILLTARDHTGAAAVLLLSGRVGTAKNPIEDGFATCIGREGIGLRSALGPATSYGDNAILDRTSGAAVVMSDVRGGVSPEGLILGFDFEKNTYTLSFADKSLYFTVRRGMFDDLFGIRYKAINKQTTFPTPPAGWMTWYAVKFDASEQVILDNAAIMKSKLYDFGANVLWVDWEWQHGALTKEGPRGVDVFTPFADRYPGGLAYLAKSLSDMGLIPALWVGFTHEPGPTGFIDEHPETVLLDHLYWYGRYTFDVSHPTWREQYLIPAAKQVPAMGYKALKWDCLPTCLSTSDKHFDKMYGKQGPWRALHEAVGIVRDVVGKDFYMMSCSGGSDRSVLFASDIFDGGRIGEDVFTWEAFEDTAKRLCHLYSLHNTVIYCDPDNVVIRDEYNASALEKRARIALVSLLGLPVTIGDDLRVLPDEDVEYYRRALPTLDAHPCDLRDYTMQDDLLTVRLSVAKPFTRFSTVGIFNFADTERTVTLSLRKDLGLIGDAFHLYDMFEADYLGTEADAVTLTLAPHECRVLRLTPVCDRPTVIATSRHISGGAPDLLDLSYEGDTLIGKSAVVAGDVYTVTVYDPKKQGVSGITITPEKTGEITWMY